MARRIGLWASVVLSVAISLTFAGSSSGPRGGAEQVAPAASIATTATPVSTQPCGAAWHVIPGVNLWPAGATFSASAATTSDDIWLVGAMSSSRDSRNTLVERWDGKEWRQVPSPSRDRLSMLMAVAAIRPNDVWAAGNSVTDRSAGAGAVQWATLIEHWDGIAWTIVPSPNDAAQDSLHQIAGLAALGPNNVWAVGSVLHWNTQSYSPLLLHWDGKSWSRISADGLGDNVMLEAVTALRPDDVWVVGTTGILGSEAPVIAHWDGHTWSRRADAGDRGYLLAITAPGPDDIWAVGMADMVGGRWRTGLIRHWDGHAWSAVANPIPAGTHSEFHAVAAYAPNDIWAGGTAGDINDPSKIAPATLHWDGVHWSEVPQPGQWAQLVQGWNGSAITTLVAIAKGDVWAAGSTIARYSDPCAAAPPVVRPFDAVSDPHDPAVTYFPPVQHTLHGVFRDYWQQHGGLEQFGYPLTEEFTETSSADGKPYVTQYFERARFEYHPENSPPYDVLLGLLGSAVTEGREGEPVFQRAPNYEANFPGTLYFDATGHNIPGPFADYWQEHGGLAVFGYPISESFVETNPVDGKSYMVQYFQRNRLEMQMNLPRGTARVTLGLLGVQVLQLGGWLK